MLIAAWVLLAVLLLWGLGAYNRLMRLRNGIALAWQQLEPALAELRAVGAQLAERGPAWLPSEGPAFDNLRQAGEELAAAVQAVAARPHSADAAARLAVAHALHAAALQRVRGLLALGVGDEHDADRQALLARLKQAEPPRDFARQLFNQRVQAFNLALDELPTRLLAGLFGFHDAGSF